jgi:hypothetical protein
LTRKVIAGCWVASKEVKKRQTCFGVLPFEDFDATLSRDATPDVAGLLRRRLKAFRIDGQTMAI